MSLSRKLILRLMLILCIISFTSTSVNPAEAIRPFNIVVQQLSKGEGTTTLAIEALPKGPVPPSGPSPCTYIPTPGNSGICRRLQGSMNFAGRGTGMAGRTVAV